VRRYEDELRDALRGLLDIPIVGDVRGAGYFWAVELVRDAATRETFSGVECEELLHEFLSPELLRRGLMCRADSRGDPVVQLSPPLIAGPDEFREIVSVLRPVLEEAAAR
jgi:adenosylmethionine-8-amino-7-oxononanoate aminotransferase